MIDKQKFKFDETPDMASHMYNKAIDIAFAHFESMRCENCEYISTTSYLSNGFCGVFSYCSRFY